MPARIISSLMMSVAMKLAPPNCFSLVCRRKGSQHRNAIIAERKRDNMVAGKIRQTLLQLDEL
jgi:hypothetical protein